MTPLLHSRAESRHVRGQPQVALGRILCDCVLIFYIHLFPTVCHQNGMHTENFWFSNVVPKDGGGPLLGNVK